MNKENTFNELITAYKKSSIDEKRTEIISEVREIITLIEKLNKDFGIQHKILSSDEVLDLNKEIVSEDDYLEGTYVYIHMLKDSIGAFLEKIVGNKYDEN